MTRLGYERRERSWSQTTLAYQARMLQPDVSVAETGRRGLSPGYAKCLSEIFGVPPDELLDAVKEQMVCQ